MTPAPATAASSSTEPARSWADYSFWTQFWHRPVRAERLALMRILLGLALLADQLFQYWPNLGEFFGPHGVAFDGLHDRWSLGQWRWTVVFFGTDDLATVTTLFWIWVAVTVCWTAGLLTRLSNVAVWLLTMAFLNRNPNLLNGGDDTLQVGIFLLLISPCGRALSLDAWLRRRLGWQTGAAWTPAWPVRLLQIQLCAIYFTTGIVKLQGERAWSWPWWPEGTWWELSSVHYVLNYVTMSRWSFAQLPLPFWVTAFLTATSVWWEVLFPFLVIEIPTPRSLRLAALGAWGALAPGAALVLWLGWDRLSPGLGATPAPVLVGLAVGWAMVMARLVAPRWTRWGTLAFGPMFHLGIWLTIEVGWFSFYMIPYYAVWLPCGFWAWLGARRASLRPVSPAASTPTTASAPAVRGASGRTATA